MGPIFNGEERDGIPGRQYYSDCGKRLANAIFGGHAASAGLEGSTRLINRGAVQRLGRVWRSSEG